MLIRRFVLVLAVALAACARNDRPALQAADRRGDTVPAATDSLRAAGAPGQTDREYVARAFMDAIGEEPRMGWLLPDGRFLAATTATELVLYAASRTPAPLRREGAVTAQERRALTRRYAVACDDTASLNAYALSNPPEHAARALFTTRALPGLRSGLVPVPVAPGLGDRIASAMGWSAGASRLDTAVAIPGDRLWYSFHARYDPGTQLLLQTALVLHDAGGVVASALQDASDYACADCEAPQLRDGLLPLFNVLNVFAATAFPYPLLLMDTGTIEGRALSLVTFTPAQRRAELREYEYVVNCGMDADRQGP